MKLVPHGVRYFVLIIAAWSLIACGGGGSSGATGDPDNGGSGGSGSGAATALEGTWQYCQEDSQGNSESITLAFNGNRFTERQNAYSDADCVNAVETLASYAGTFAIGDSLITKNGLEVDELDMRYTSGVPANQTTSLYDIFYIQNQTLYKGLVTSENDLQSPASRPDEIYFSAPYYKQ